MGYSRIGCILCPMSQHKQKIREMEMFPYVKRNWLKAIKAIRDGGVSRDKRTGARYSQLQWNTMFQRLAVEVPRREEITPTTSKQPPLEQESQHRDLGWIQHPDKQHWTGNGFSDNPSTSGEVEGYREPTEDEIAENIFDWWISGKSYSKWYADKFLQLKIPFDFEERESK